MGQSSVTLNHCGGRAGVGGGAGAGGAGGGPGAGGPRGGGGAELGRGFPAHPRKTKQKPQNSAVVPPPPTRPHSVLSETSVQAVQPPFSVLLWGLAKAEMSGSVFCLKYKEEQ